MNYGCKIADHGPKSNPHTYIMAEASKVAAREVTKQIQAAVSVIAIESGNIDSTVKQILSFIRSIIEVSSYPNYYVTCRFQISK